MSQKNVIDTKIRFEADIAAITQATKDIQANLGKLQLSAGLEKSFTSALTKLQNEISNFEAKAARGISTMGDSRALESSGKKILDLYNQLQNQIKGLGTLSNSEMSKLFPDSVGKNIKDAIKLLNDYEASHKKTQATIEQETKELKKQEAELERLKKLQEELQKTPVGNDSDFRKKNSLKRKIEEAPDKRKEILDQAQAEGVKLRKNKQEIDRRSTGSEEWVKKLELFDATIKKTQESYDALVKKLEGKIPESTLEKQMQKNQTAIQNTERKVEGLKKDIKELGDTDAKGLNTTVEKINKLTKLDLKNLETGEAGIRAIDEALSGLTTEELQKVRDYIDTLDESALQAVPALESLKDRLDEAGKEAKELTDTQRELESFKNNVLQFFSIGNTVQLFKRAVSSAVDTIKELDAAMTEIAVVSDYDISDMWDKLPEFTQMANEMGVSIKSAYESTTLYIQQGLNFNDSLALSTETLKMARIAGLSAADATDAMTAAMRGFNMEINETSAQKINDVYSQLAAITASNVAEISKAMSKTASIASSANMEFETTAAFLSQIIETTRESAETAGTAMKTVIARFQELKKDPSEIGEVDGEIVDANKIETALRTIGVSLRDAQGQFRDLDDVFLEIAQKWDSLDTNTQRYIATMAAGSRQQSRFIAMMSDYDRTMELVSAANNSSGASQEQFEKTTESLETAITNLKNAWDQFTMKIMNSEVLTFGVNVLTSILEIINKLLEKLGSFGGMASGILLLFGALKTGKTIFEGIFSSMFATGTTAAKKGGAEAGRAWMQAWDTETKAKLKTWADSKKKTKIKKSRNTKGKNQNSATEQTVMVKTTVNVEQTKAELQNKLNEIKDDELKKKIQVAIDENDTEKIEQLRKELLETEDSIEVVEKKGSKFNLDSMLGVMTGIEQAAGATGAALLALGGAFQQSENKGVQRFGEVISKVGMGLTVLSTIMSVVVPAAGWIMSGQLTAAIASIPIVGWIVMATALLTSFLALFASIGKENPYEEQLKELEEATKKAGEAAEEAKQAYDSLLSSLTEHNSAIDSLSELTKGTKEWKQALWETNQQVLELLKTYPELGKYLIRDEETGALTFEAEGLVEVQQQYLDKAIDAQNRTLGLQAYTYGTETQDARYKVEAEFRRLNAFIDSEKQTEMWENLDRLIGDKDFREELIGLPSGEIEGLIKLMEEQRKAEELNTQLYQGQTQAMLAINASSGILNSEYSNQITDMFANTFNPYKVEEAFATVANNYTPDIGNGKGEMSRDDAVSKYKTLNTGATDAEIEAMSDEQLATAIGIAEAQKKQVEAMETFYANFSELGVETQKKFMAAFSDGGKDMTKKNLTELEKILNATDADGNPLSNEAIVALWRDAMGMTEEQLQVFMDTMGYDVNQMVTFLQGQVEMANSTFETAVNNLKQVGLDSIAQAISGIDVTAAEQKTLASSMYTIFLRAGKEGAEGATQALQGLMSGLTTEQVQLLVQAFNAVDWTSLDSVEEFSEIAKALGINIPLNELEDFESTMSQVAKSTKKVDLKSILDQFSSLADAEDIVKDKIKEKNSVYTQEERDKLVGLGAKEEDFVRVSLDEFVFMGETEALLDVISDDVKKIADDVVPGVEAAIQEGTKFSTLPPEQLDLVESIMSGAKGFANENGQVVDINGNIIDGVDAGNIEDLRKIVGTITGLTSGELENYSLENLYSLLKYRYDTYYGLGGSVLKGNIDTYTGVKSQGVDEVPLDYTSSEEILKDIAEKFSPKVVTQIIQALTADGEKIDFAISYSYEGASEFKKATTDLNTLKTALEAQAKYYGVNAQVMGEYNKALEKTGGRLTQYSAAILLNAIEEKKAEERMGNTLVLLEELTSKYSDAAELIRDDDAVSLIAQALGFEDIDENALDFVKTNIQDIFSIVQGDTAAFQRMQEKYFNTIKNKYKNVPVTFDMETGKIDTSSLEDATEEVKKQWEDMVTELSNSGLFKLNTVVTPRILEKNSGRQAVIFDAGETAEEVAALTIMDFLQAFLGAFSQTPDKNNNKEVENSYDKRHNRVQDINAALREREKLEREYNRLLESESVTGQALYENVQKQIEALKEEKELQKALLEERKLDFEQYMQNNSKYSKYGWYDEDTKTIKIDWDELEALRKSNPDKYEDVDAYIQEAINLRNDVKEVEDAIDENTEEIEKLQDVGEQDYLDLEGRILSALIQKQQDLIDAQEETNNAIDEAANDMIDSIQNNIDKLRQDRQNEDTETSLAEKERRLAYLRQDTSGANAMEIKRLEEEIAKERESYGDSLVDQALQDLQSQNDEAAEQRERQITLMQEQLEWQKETGYYAAEAHRIFEDTLQNGGLFDTNSEFYQLITSTEGWGALAHSDQMQKLEEIRKALAAAYNYLMNKKEDEVPVDYENTDYLAIINDATQRFLRGELDFNEALRIIQEAEKLRDLKINTKDASGVTYGERYNASPTNGSLAEDFWSNYGQYAGGYYDGGSANTGAPTETEEGPMHSLPEVVKSTDTANIKKMQEGLNSMKAARVIKFGADLAIDGKYGPKTQAAVKALQAELEVPQDGWWGKVTYAAFMARADLKQFKTGGLADFTGLAWLDGTKSRPEMVLNARDTENFIILKDVLSSLLHLPQADSMHGDNYFDIDVQVEEISDDYDVDQVIERVKEKIYEDSMYRNNNSISLKR